jgi:hypothetical protein
MSDESVEPEDEVQAVSLNASGVTCVRFHRDADGNWSNPDPIDEPDVILFGDGPTMSNGQRMSIRWRTVIQHPY